MRRVLACALVFAVGCQPDDGRTIFVDLRTDFVAGVEIESADVDLIAGDGDIVRHREVTILFGAELLGGLRVAELDGVMPGSYVLRARLREADGTIRGSRRIAVEVSGDLVVTVVITRSCEGIECPGVGDSPTQTECVDRQCVEPGCQTVDGRCGEGCVVDGDCANGGCGRGTCVEGVCFTVADDALCAAPETCSLSLGCVSDGEPDAGIDGGFDAGFDGGFDAGVDAGPPPPPPPSCPANGADCSSGERQGWSRDASWSCRADGALGRARGTLTCRVCNSGGCRDCTYNDVTVECRCRDNVCSGGRCPDVVNSSSRCDDGTEFSCREISDREC